MQTGEQTLCPDMSRLADVRGMGHAGDSERSRPKADLHAELRQTDGLRCKPCIALG